MESDEEIYYGVLIPFDTKEEAEFARVYIFKATRYGGWIHSGIYGDGEDC